ncbi:uncharacterized protein TNCT_53601 [Trichonephila clavata]|uniref:Uncharacterized protein n=1 Tax=Trichonephila clavata TaxID=2740835 RepID=A0A8X6KJ03_TRICU|nr:uncharacterized protein TNCT_53601 [Trichonephila clavata]
MKLSVSTFRAGTQRLTTLWQANQTKPPTHGASRPNFSTSSDAEDDDIECLIPRRSNSLDSFDMSDKKEMEPRTPRSITTLGLSQVGNTDECALFIRYRYKSRNIL